MNGEDDDMYEARRNPGVGGFSFVQAIRLGEPIFLARGELGRPSTDTATTCRPVVWKSRH